MPSKGSVSCVCETCGETFFATPSRVNTGGGRFCSQQCRYSRVPHPILISDDGATAQVPLISRDDTIRAYAMIDSSDAAWAGRWRWILCGAYAGRCQTVDGIRLTFLMHRELLGLSAGDGLEGDHQNLNKLDDRRANLRIVPKHGNRQNKGSRPGSSSRYRGVSWDKQKGKWVAQVNVQGRHFYLGRFSEETAAAEAAKIGRQRLLPYAID